jgi:cysteine synthase A
MTELYQPYPGFFLKLEFQTVGRSHKFRAARRMIDDLQNKGQIQPGRGDVLVERTGGNMGLGLAIECRRRGYQLELIIDPSYSQYRKLLLKKYGARLIGKTELLAGKSKNEIAEQRIAEHKKDGRHAVYLNQFLNPSHVQAHEEETGPEIVSQLLEAGVAVDSPITFVSVFGTGASLTGIARALRKRFQQLRVVAIQPNGNDVRTNTFTPHSIQGISISQPVPLLDFEVITEFLAFDVEHAVEAQERLLKELGLYSGLSSAANFLISKSIYDEQGGVVLSVIYDLGDLYYFDQIAPLAGDLGE